MALVGDEGDDRGNESALVAQDARLGGHENRVLNWLMIKSFQITAANAAATESGVHCSLLSHEADQLHGVDPARS